MKEYAKGVIATIAAGGFTLRELLTNGSLLFTMLGAALALAAGWWTYRTAQTRAEIAELDKQRAELELQLALGRGNNVIPFSPQHPPAA